MASSKRQFISAQNKYDRVVLLVDMDCFYCQVEEKLDQSLAGKPLAVVQYNAWRGGGIIAVNYAARARGVTRHMRGDEAKEQCPDIQLVKVPNVREKADLGKYRDAGKEVATVLQSFTPLLERASVDEAYLDISQIVHKRLEEMNAGTFILKPNELQNTYAVGYNNIGEYISEITAKLTEPNDAANIFVDDNDFDAVRSSDTRLLIGASIANEIRSAVKQITGYECSAGIAHNKILAKLACGINKPNKQTILPLSKIGNFFETLSISKIKGLGAKFGEEICEKLGVRYLGELTKFSEAELQRKFDEKNGSWLYNICRGIDLEAVTVRFYSKSIGCCKKFPGRNNINGLNTLNHWLTELAGEIIERLEKDIVENNRRAKQMVVSYIQDINGEEVSSSRSVPLISYEKDKLVKSCLEVIKANTKQFFRVGSTSALNNPLKFVGISVGKFETLKSDKNNLQEMFANQLAKKRENGGNSGCLENKVIDKLKNHNKPLSTFKEIKESSFKGPEELEKRVHDTNETINTESNLNKDYLPKGNKSAADTGECHKILDIKQLESNALVIDGKLAPAKIDKTDNSSDVNLLNTKTNSLEAGSKTSFFRNALKKQNSKLVCDEILSSQTTSTSKPATEDDDVIKLESEIKLINNEKVMNTTLNTTANNCEDLPICIKRKHDDLTDRTASLNIDQPSKLKYQAEYAEFAVPQLRPEMLDFTLCDVCNKRVLSDERSLREHQDHHIAQQLSKQQRIEFREEFRKKFLVGKSPTNLNKSSKKSKSVTNSTKISKYLKQSQLGTTKNERNDLQNTEKSIELKNCSECHLEIPSAEMDEHLDYHVAKTLHRKLNQLEVRTVAIVKKKNKALNQHKNVINSSSLLNLSNSDATPRTIMEFFTPSNS